MPRGAVRRGSGVAPALLAQLLDFARKALDVALDAVPFGPLPLVRDAIVCGCDRAPPGGVALFDVVGTLLARTDERFLEKSHRGVSVGKRYALLSADH